MSSETQIQRCDCGRAYLTDDQYKAHKVSCDAKEQETEGKGLVCKDRCTLWRKLLPTYDKLEYLIEDTDYSSRTVRVHLRNDCEHDSWEFYWEWTGKYWEARQE